MSLKDELQEISGVGPATAEEIMGLLEGRDTGGVAEADVRKALRFAERGHMAGCVETLRDALD